MTFRFSFGSFNTLLIAVIFGLRLSVVPTLAQTPRYAVTDLGTLGTDPFQTEAQAINNSGQVVGYSGSQAFLYSNGVMRSLGTLPGGQYSRASDINDAGQIAGSSEVRTPDTAREHAFLYSNGVMTDLGLIPDKTDSSASRLNSSGQVVGTSYYYFGPSRVDTAFLYGNGLMRSITDLGAFADAPAINDSGQVVGSFFFGGDGGPCRHAFIFSDNRVRDIGALPGDACSQGQAINNHGQAAGVSVKSFSSGEVYRLFLYSGGVMQDLGRLGDRPSSVVRGMNNSGQIVGGFWPEGVDRFSAFLYGDGVLADLNTLIPADSGWVLTVANDINESGQIVGRGLWNGKMRAFLLTPARPVLLTEPNSDKAVALDSVTFVRDSFPVATTQNFSGDQRTRVVLFARGVSLAPGETASVLTAQAEDDRHGIYPLPVEHVGPVPQFGGVTQIVVRLPDELAGGGDVRVNIALRGVASNKGIINVRPAAGSPP